MSRKENRERFHPTPKGSGYSRVLNHKFKIDFALCVASLWMKERRLR